MRVFAGDKVKGLMDKLGMPEDQPIQNRIVSKSLESAQTKIEGFNFDSRKQVLQYDDVLNTQRKAVYERRRAILTGTPDVIEAKLGEVFLGDEAVQKIIEDKIKDIGRERFLQVARQLMLQVIDMFWVEHLEIMDYTRSSVNLRAYGQRDPLVEYKKEGLRLFREMQEAINNKILELLPHIGGGIITQPQPKLQEVRSDADAITGAGGRTSGNPPASKKSEVGRNDPCPCGSGKKYKNCGLKNTEEHQKLMVGK
jgi:preprotein translocase subunit SecA